MVINKFYTNSIWMFSPHYNQNFFLYFCLKIISNLQINYKGKNNTNNSIYSLSRYLDSVIINNLLHLFIHFLFLFHNFKWKLHTSWPFIPKYFSIHFLMIWIFFFYNHRVDYSKFNTIWIGKKFTQIYLNCFC